MRNKKEGIVVAIFAVFFLSSITFAVACPIPDTGQTKCYDDTEEITCPTPGESFYGQDAQYGPNLQSYTKLDENGNDLPDTATEWVMVRDNVTGLIWEVKTDDDTIHDKDNTYTWQDAQDVFIDTLNSQNFGGHSDWRLPTIKELSTIVDSSISYPGPYFPNNVSDYYWSSTALVHDPMQYTWVIDFDNVIVHFLWQSSDVHVRAVRAGQCGSFGDYIDIGDGTVTDTDTGLMWEVKTFDNMNNQYNWEQALDYCENLSLSYYDDWRLPNRNELQSLNDYSQYNPSIDTIFFPNTKSSWYWSSTTYAGRTYHAWYVHFEYGPVGYGTIIKPDYNYVRAVRGGQCGAFGDSDDDGICDDGDVSGVVGDNPCTGGEKLNCDDNCPNDYNPFQIDCDEDGEGDVCDGDTIDNDGDGIDDGEGEGHGCDNCPNDYNPNQEDTYPPQGNGIGDACDCEADFDCSGSVDSLDVEHFLWDFGRSEYNDPCTNERWCYGDFLCDGSVDAADVTKFLEDFGRSEFFNPCPACEVGDWCNYSEPPTTTTVPITTTTIVLTTTTTTAAPPPPPPECELTISPSNETVYTWETVQFGTTLSGDCDAPCYDWEVLTSVGSIIDSDGLYTAGGTAGIDTVTVTDNCNEYISDSAIVEVLFFPTTTVPPTTTTSSIP